MLLNRSWCSLELFYDCTIVLSGVHYPTSPLVLHHILDIAEHLKKAENDVNFRSIAYPMKLKFLKYWEKIPLLYSYAFIHPIAKMKGFKLVLELLAKATRSTYSSYYADVKDEMYKLFNKYVQKFGGATVAQRAIQPTAHAGAW